MFVFASLFLENDFCTQKEDKQDVFCKADLPNIEKPLQQNEMNLTTNKTADVYDFIDGYTIES